MDQLRAVKIQQLLSGGGGDGGAPSSDESDGHGVDEESGLGAMFARLGAQSDEDATAAVGRRSGPPPLHTAGSSSSASSGGRTRPTSSTEITPTPTPAAPEPAPTRQPRQPRQPNPPLVSAPTGKPALGAVVSPMRRGRLLQPQAGAAPRVGTPGGARHLQMPECGDAEILQL